MENFCITITFGDCAESHVGMEKIGSLSKSGFTNDDLIKAKRKFKRAGLKCKLVDLVKECDVESEVGGSVYVLIVRNVLGLWGGVNSVLEEQKSLEPDKKAFMKGRVVKKRARYNLCFSDYSQEADFSVGKGTVINFSDVPKLNKIREILPTYLGVKAKSLQAEGNYYYDVEKCGIGWHGDAERKKVIALRMGETIPLCYNWFQNSDPFGKKAVLKIRSGDLYVMSEKATGFDWRLRKVPTLRHSAGCSNYTKLS